jgi:alpha-tubulin suppressor-like RCC1 family protein
MMVRKFVVAVALSMAGCQYVSDGTQVPVASAKLVLSPLSLRSGETAIATLTALDSTGAPTYSPGRDVELLVLSESGTSSGGFGTITDNQDGTYAATFTAQLAGKPVAIGARFDGAVTRIAAPPSISVSPGSLSLSGSVLLPASRARLAAGETTRLTLETADAFGNPVVEAGRTVDFVVGQGTSSGTFSSTVDNGDGTYTSVFTAKTAGSASTLEARIDGAPLSSAPQVVEVTPGPAVAASSTTSLSVSTVAADGTTAITATVAFADAYGNPAEGESVTLGSSRGTPDSITPASAVTGPDGRASFKITSRTPGGATFFATDSLRGLALPGVSVTFTAGAASPALSTVVAFPIHPEADGSSASRVSVVLTDSSGHALPGKSVSLSSSRGSSDTIVPVVATTSSAGSASFTVTSTVAGSALLTATDASDSVVIAAGASISFIAGGTNASRSTISASPASVTADGASQVVVTVVLEDAFSNVVGGKNVKLVSSRGNTDLIVPPIATIDGGGQARFTVTSTLAGTAVLSASAASDSIPLTSTVSASFVPGKVSAATSTLASNLSSLVADGASSATLSVTLRDANLNAVSGKSVSLTSSRGSSDLVAPASAVTDSSGHAVFSVSSTLAGAAKLSVSDATDALSVGALSLVFKPGPVSASRSTVAPSSASVVADGATTDTITVRLLDAFSNPVAGKSVSLLSSRGSLDALSGGTASTDATGAVTFLVSSSHTGAAVFSAADTSDSRALTSTAGVTFSAGAVVLAKSSLTFSASSVVADGSTAIGITVALRDAFSNPVPGKTVGVSTTRVASDSLSASTLVTDAGGGAVFQLRSTLAGSTTVAVIDSSDGLSFASSVETFVAGPGSASKSTLSIAPASLPADGATAGTATVTLLDAFLNPVPGKFLSLASSRGGADTLVANAFVTDVNGQITFQLTSLVSGAPVFTATDTTDSVTIARTASVTYLPGAVTAAQSGVAASPASVVADGATASVVTVTLRDVNGNGVPGKTVTLASSRGATDTISPASAVSGANGSAAFNVTSKLAGSSTFTGTDTTDPIGVTQTAAVTFVAGAVVAASSTVAASLASIPNNGTTTSTVTVTLLDAFLNPVAGKTVTLTSSRGASDTISPASVASSAAGAASFTVKSTTRGSAVLTAKDTTDTLTLAPTISLKISLSATQVAASQQHACAVMSDHTVQCWGLNFSGQLGDGTTTDRSSPVQVSGISTATAVAVGATHSCALLASKAVQCWGGNASGQLGNNTTTQSLSPVSAGSISTATAIALGNSHSCAVLSSGVVQCWGNNASSQLGDGTTTNRLVPTAVSGISTATAVVAQAASSCALLSTHAVSCWGSNTFGNLGDATTTNRATPVAVSGLTTAAALGAGYSHACAVLTTGAAKCWGNNASGQLGNGTTTQSSSPVSVTGVTTASTIAGIGGAGTCAVLASHQLQCWGDNSYGSVGDGTLTARLTPVNVSGMSAVSQVTGGAYHVCALLTDGSARCWGDDPRGNLGTGAVAASSTPTGGSGIASPASVAVGWGHACALASGGTIQCWGSNFYGQLGDGTTTDRVAPVTVSGIANAVAVAAGQYHSCAVLLTGAVECWGDNSTGAIGDGTVTQRLTPTAATGVTTATAIAAGAYSTCALLSSNAVSCWGSNAFGTVGDGTTTDRHSPTAVSGITSATALAHTNYHSCALLTGGSVKCWGYNPSGALGNNTTVNQSTPVAVTGISTATGIATGGYHSCALLSGGTVQCWGDNEDGEVGDGTLTQRLTPVTVSGVSGIAQLALGLYHSCALASSHGLQCWGDNAWGEVGDATSAGTRTGATSVSGISTAQAAASGGGESTCATLANGSVQCWGANGFGELGTGVANDARTAALVLLF